MANNSWPTLILEEWQDTLATLHMWTQIVGKIQKYKLREMAIRELGLERAAAIRTA